MPFPTALAASLVVALVGFGARALSWSGVAAATVVGAALLWQTGVPGAVVLGVYFILSTLVSRLTARSQDHTLGAKGDRRDAWQVLANGGAAAAGALFERWQSGAGLWLAAISLAAAASDTWATAFGALSPKPPVDIVRLRPVPKGTSGGISALGSLGGLAGAALVGLTAWSATGDRRLGLTAAATGFGCMLIDSALGATVQGKFVCDSCEGPTEQRRHHCGAVTRRVGGVAWISNDWVNAATTTAALLAGLLLWRSR